MKRIRSVVLFCLLIFSVVVGGETLPVLRFSLPPVLESLPIAFAYEWGLFEKHGVDVRLVGITDNQQRSAALITGNLDGLIGDITRAILDASAGGDVLITSTASLSPQTGSIGMAIMSPASFRHETFEELIDAGAAIATIFRSDYEYVLDKFLHQEFGEDARSVRTMYFNDMMQMAVWFGAQTLPAAMLPEPYISYLQTYFPPGGEPIAMNMLVDLSALGPLPSVIMFRSAYVRDNHAAIEAFYRAYIEAIERINNTPRDELLYDGIDITISLFFRGGNREDINQEALDALIIPRYQLPAILTQQLFESVGNWMLEKDHVVSLPDFHDVTDFQFIP